jgi:CheY-like chemotaxis protein
MSTVTQSEEHRKHGRLSMSCGPAPNLADVPLLVHTSTLEEVGVSSADYILIVDDDRDIREALAEYLLETGHDVRVAANGREALDVLQRWPHPALIVLDLWMPVMDGMEFIQQKNRIPVLVGIPVCIVTANEPTGSPGPGVVSIMRKPIDTEALISVVERFS